MNWLKQALSESTVILILLPFIVGFSPLKDINDTRMFGSMAFTEILLTLGLVMVVDVLRRIILAGGFLGVC